MNSQRLLNYLVRLKQFYNWNLCLTIFEPDAVKILVDRVNRRFLLE